MLSSGHSWSCRRGRCARAGRGWLQKTLGVDVKSRSPDAVSPGGTMHGIVDSRCVLAVRDLQASARGFMSTYSDFAGISATVRMAGVFCHGDTSKKYMLGECAGEKPASELGDHSSVGLLDHDRRRRELDRPRRRSRLWQHRATPVRWRFGRPVLRASGSSIVRSIDGGREWDVVFTASPHLLDSRPGLRRRSARAVRHLRQHARALW